MSALLLLTTVSRRGRSQLTPIHISDKGSFLRSLVLRAQILILDPSESSCHLVSSSMGVKSFLENNFLIALPRLVSVLRRRFHVILRWFLL